MTDITDSAHLTGSAPPHDPRAIFAQAVALGGTVVAGVRSDQLGAPTPCEDYDVRALLGHLLAVLRRVAAIGRGDDPFSVPQVAEGVADDGWPTVWSAAAHEVQAAWADDAAVSRMVRLPWAEMPGGPTLDMYTGEIVTHLWDLATATVQEPAWDDGVVAVALASARRVLPAGNRAAMFEEVRATLPPDQRDWKPPFAEAVPVDADAPAIHQLVAWFGRRP